MARVESSISSEGLGLVGPWFGLGWLGMSLGVTKRLSEGLVVALGRNIWDKSRAGPNLSQMGPCARPVRLRASCRSSQEYFLGRNIWDKSRAGPNLSQMGPCARPVRLRASCRALTVEIYDGYWAVKVPCGNINLTRNGLQKSTGVPYIDGTGFQKSTGMPFQA
ncbi:hypothetical protein F511_37867 [Dorcoceras hygrometricum]|uniref:Uncharacterized protein n=1 Tax=Dorcoceras hygrometricum TaxID=472368 RepID=A0A2Z7CVD4_9LAMI|nr:hypothetical protein F511_37867 [Dorcoceras hygrometricum]